jgi:hypothetical protein
MRVQAAQPRGTADPDEADAVRQQVVPTRRRIGGRRLPGRLTGGTDGDGAFAVELPVIGVGVDDVHQSVRGTVSGVQRSGEDRLVLLKLLARLYTFLSDVRLSVNGSVGPIGRK